MRPKQRKKEKMFKFTLQGIKDALFNRGANASVAVTPDADFDLNDQVMLVARDYVRGKKMFSAYNVTNKVRENNDGEDVPHNAVRDIMKRFSNDPAGMVRDGYETTLVSLPNGAATYVYHPFGTDANLFTGDVISSGTAYTPPTQTSSSVVTVQPTLLNSSLKATILANAYNRVRVPSAFVREIGAAPGDALVFSNNNGVATLGRYVIGNTKYTVDAYSNVQVAWPNPTATVTVENGAIKLS